MLLGACLANERRDFLTILTVLTVKRRDATGVDVCRQAIERDENRRRRSLEASASAFEKIRARRRSSARRFRSNGGPTVETGGAPFERRRRSNVKSKTRRRAAGGKGLKGLSVDLVENAVEEAERFLFAEFFAEFERLRNDDRFRRFNETNFISGDAQNATGDDVDAGKRSVRQRGVEGGVDFDATVAVTFEETAGEVERFGAFGSGQARLRFGAKRVERFGERVVSGPIASRRTGVKFFLISRLERDEASEGTEFVNAKFVVGHCFLSFR